MNDKFEMVQSTVEKAGQKANAYVEEKAKKHNYTKFQVCVGLSIVALAVVGFAKVLGWI